MVSSLPSVALEIIRKSSFKLRMNARPEAGSISYHTEYATDHHLKTRRSPIASPQLFAVLRLCYRWPSLCTFSRVLVNILLCFRTFTHFFHEISHFRAEYGNFPISLIVPFSQKSSCKFSLGNFLYDLQPYYVLKCSLFSFIPPRAIKQSTSIIIVPSASSRRLLARS